MEIHGLCHDRFVRVREEFERNFTQRNDVGATFALTMDGEYVIDLWAGHKDRARTEPWEEDTIVNVYSTTKTMTFLVSLMLADRGELDFDTPVAAYWPEFAQNGKDKIPVKNLLSHSAGLPGFSRKFSSEELYDWNACVEDLASQAPWWEPGTASGYHALTQGYLIGEVVRRITGRTIGTFFREEVADKVGADFHIGVDPSDFDRIAPIISAPPSERREKMDPESIPARVFSGIDLRSKTSQSEGWRRAEIPAANGHGNARSVVKAQTAMANGGTAFGVELLSEAGTRRALEEQTNGPDKVLIMPIRFGLGYAFSNEFLKVSPSENGIWWAGAGGSTIVVDMDQHLCFSYVMNQMGSALVGDSRGGVLGSAVYSSLGLG